jgi:hypothetical protein
LLRREELEFVIKTGGRDIALKSLAYPPVCCRSERAGMGVGTIATKDGIWIYQPLGRE